ncbi:MAG: SIMPL domain-containing protein [Patescibacteria group bacterium]|nr:SIMPL domain-containing protein [Patescibacteria group bacterium]
METLEENKKKLYKVAFILLIILSAYFAVRIFSELKKTSMLGESATPTTISFSGHGEVTAVPDIATIDFTISKDDATVKNAQAGVATIEKKALDFLKTKGVADKDIQTANASFYPKYEYRQAACPPIPMGTGTAGGTVNTISPYYCPPSRQVITGYTASESITVKVRNTDDAGAIMQGLGATGVSNLNGPNFEIDNPEVLKGEARKKAIDEAKAKAVALAKDLGVSLGKIASFNESGNSPIMYAKDSLMASGVAPAPAEIPKGQNTITSDVTITYEIR